LSKRPSSKIVETVRCRHFSASLAPRSVSLLHPLFRIYTQDQRTGTSSLFASCTLRSDFPRIALPHAFRLRNILSIEPTEASVVRQQVRRILNVRALPSWFESSWLQCADIDPTAQLPSPVHR